VYCKYTTKLNDEDLPQHTISIQTLNATEPNSIGNNNKTTAAAGSIIGIEEREKPQ